MERLVIKIEHASSLMSCWTTWGLGSLKISKFQESLKTAFNYSLVSSLFPKIKILSILVKKEL